jgi:hypothetical protein
MDCDPLNERSAFVFGSVSVLLGVVLFDQCGQTVLEFLRGSACQICRESKRRDYVDRCALDLPIIDAPLALVKMLGVSDAHVFVHGASVLANARIEDHNPFARVMEPLSPSWPRSPGLGGRAIQAGSKRSRLATRYSVLKARTLA